MKVHATVVTVPTCDHPGTNLVVHFDDKRYIFGHISEGTQRVVGERRLRLGKVQDIFITGRTEWASTGGLVGFLLTMGDTRKATDQKAEGAPVNVHGGENLLQTIAATRSFVFRDQLKMRANEILEGNEEFRDENIVVKALHIRPQKGTVESAGRKRPAYEMADEQERVGILKKIVEGMFASQRNVNKTNEIDEVDPLVTGEELRGKRSRTSSEDVGHHGIPEQITTEVTAIDIGNQLLPDTTPSPISLSYIMTLHDHRGKFLPKVAIGLGVVPGPSFRHLADGKAVTTPSGRVVQPHEVIEPSITGTGIAICDLPEVEYIEDFVSHREWSDTAMVQKKLGCFFWILGPGVSQDPRLLEFMNQFPDSKHVVASPDVCPDRICFQGAAKFTTRFNHLDPIFFPPLYSNSTTIPPPEGAVVAEPGLLWNIEPAWSLNTENFLKPFDPQKALSEGEVADFLSIATDIRESFAQSPTEVEKFPGSDVEVYTLGTGSALPSRYRNVSSTLVTIPGNCSILLDCGESTVGQMKRVLGPEEFNKRLLDIKALYISHLHADHHLGSISLLKAQRQMLRASGDESRCTFIVAPNRFWKWLNDYSAIEDFGIKYLVFIPNEQIDNVTSDHFIPPSKYFDLLQILKMTQWETAPALHCQSSFTTALTFSSGFKLAYSGDTRPTRSFVDIGRDATLLVHEATFDNELIKDAIAKKHSTIGEAVKAGKDMGARKTALIHFSQRYPKAPTFGEDAGDVIYGFDYMRFRVGEVSRFQRLVRGLEEVYRGEEEGNVG